MKTILSLAAAGVLLVTTSLYADPWKDESGHGRGGPPPWAGRGGGPPPWAGRNGEPPDWARGRGVWDGHWKHGYGVPPGHAPRRRADYFGPPSLYLPPSRRDEWRYNDHPYDYPRGPYGDYYDFRRPYSSGQGRIEFWWESWR